MQTRHTETGSLWKVARALNNPGGPGREFVKRSAGTFFAASRLRQVPTVTGRLWRSSAWAAERKAPQSLMQPAMEPACNRIVCGSQTDQAPGDRHLGDHGVALRAGELRDVALPHRDGVVPAGLEPVRVAGAHALPGLPRPAVVVLPGADRLEPAGPLFRAS